MGPIAIIPLAMAIAIKAGKRLKRHLRLAMFIVIAIIYISGLFLILFRILYIDSYYWDSTLLFCIPCDKRTQ